MPSRVNVRPPYAAQDEVDVYRYPSPPQPAYAIPRRARANTSQSHLVPKHARNDSDPQRWFTFTIPNRYMKRVEDYMKGGQEKEHDPEKQQPRDKGWRAMSFRRNTDAHESDDNLPAAQMSAHISSTPQRTSASPGWMSPWQPWSTSHQTDFFSRNRYLDDPEMAKEERASKRSRLQKFLINNPYAPLTLRLINVAFASTSLALAIRIRHLERQHSLQGIIGASTTFCIIIAPLTLLHVLVSLWADYFGRPIGVLSMGRKMLYTLSELLFISLWSAELAIGFDNYFSSSLECSTFNPQNSYGRNREVVVVAVDQSVSNSLQDALCDEQAALVSITFVSLILYVLILTSSLFRIFDKIRTH